MTTKVNQEMLTGQAEKGWGQMGEHLENKQQQQ